MEQPVLAQLTELGRALGLGAALGLLYLLLGLLRRGRLLTAFLDLVYCGITLLALLFFALYAGGGRLRLWDLTAIFAAWGSVLFLGKKLQKFLKKVVKKAKNMLHLEKNLLQY